MAVKGNVLNFKPRAAGVSAPAGGAPDYVLPVACVVLILVVGAILYAKRDKQPDA